MIQVCALSRNGTGKDWMAAVEANAFFPVSPNLKQSKTNISIKDVMQRKSPEREV